MPRKVRQLKADLKQAGFVQLPKQGKGSHTRWQHPSGPTVTLSGHDGDDVQPYHERQVRQAIEDVVERA